MKDELYELCREVKERTKWSDASLAVIRDDGAVLPAEDFYLADEDGFTTLYTCEFLLQKLPRTLTKDSDDWADDSFYLVLTPGERSWYAHYALLSGKELRYGVNADTPLKVLLRLVIVLLDAREILIKTEAAYA